MGIQEARQLRYRKRSYSTLESEHSPVDGFLNRAFSKVAWQALCHIAPGRKLSVKLASGQTLRARVGDFGYRIHQGDTANFVATPL